MDNTVISEDNDPDSTATMLYDYNRRKYSVLLGSSILLNIEAEFVLDPRINIRAVLACVQVTITSELT